MNDLINRQAAIDALGEEPEVWTREDEYELGLRNQWRYDINALKGVPPAHPEDKCGECDAWNHYKNYPQQQWIPVSERLPESIEGVLVCGREALNNSVIYAVKWYDNGVWRPIAAPSCAWEAWMPLPEPYKEDK